MCPRICLCSLEDFMDAKLTRQLPKDGEPNTEHNSPMSKVAKDSNRTDSNGVVRLEEATIVSPTFVPQGQNQISDLLNQSSRPVNRNIDAEKIGWEFSKKSSSGSNLLEREKSMSPNFTNPSSPEWLRKGGEYVACSLKYGVGLLVGPGFAVGAFSMLDGHLGNYVIEISLLVVPTLYFANWAVRGLQGGFNKIKTKYSKK